jgi:hypothetical protein
MNEDTSLPQPFSRMEIATIAAMLLGKFAKDSEYRSACESALNLLTIAEEVADKYDPAAQGFENPPWELLDQNGSKANPDHALNTKLMSLGFKNGSRIDPESDIRVAWDKFWKDILHPKKPAEKKEENFKNWLLSKVSSEEAFSILSKAKDYGVHKMLVIMYLQDFPAWFKDYNSRRNRESGKTGAKEKKSMAEKRKNAKQ